MAKSVAMGPNTLSTRAGGAPTAPSEVPTMTGYDHDRNGSLGTLVAEVPTLASRDLAGSVLPKGYRIGWRFCLLPTLHRGRTVWLRSIPLLHRDVRNVSMGVDWGEKWVTVALLDDTPAGKASVEY